jgi:hypothetical protein
LTPFLGGDAVNDYPNLANIPTPCWAETVLNGSVYGGVRPAGAFLNAFLVRQDMVDQAGLALPTSADAFEKFLIAMTNAQRNQFGLACAGQSMAVQARLVELVVAGRIDQILMGPNVAVQRVGVHLQGDLARARPPRTCRILTCPGP